MRRYENGVRRAAAVMGVGVMALWGLLPAQAQAQTQIYSNDYCREYTRTVYIGGQTQNAYGTACLQPDGDWVIVGEGLGLQIPVNASRVNYVVHDNNRVIVPQRVIYRSTRVTPAPTFIWYKGGHYHGGQRTVYHHRVTPPARHIYHHQIRKDVRNGPPRHANSRHRNRHDNKSRR